MALMTRVNNKFGESIRLAKVKAAYGIRGELFIFPFTPKARWIHNLSQITLTKDHNKVSHLMQHKSSKSIVNSGIGSNFTFNMEYFKSQRDGYIVKLYGCDDRTEAEKWCGAFVSVPMSHFISRPGEEIYLIELKDFMVISLEQQVGPIVSFSSNGYQDIIQVRKDGRLYDIPFVKEFLIQIDWQAKSIYMDLPEGLFDKTPIKNMKQTLLVRNKPSKARKKANLFAT